MSVSDCEIPVVHWVPKAVSPTIHPRIRLPSISLHNSAWKFEKYSKGETNVCYQTLCDVPSNDHLQSIPISVIHSEQSMFLG